MTLLENIQQKVREFERKNGIESRVAMVMATGKTKDGKKTALYVIEGHKEELEDDFLCDIYNIGEGLVRHGEDATVHALLHGIKEALKGGEE